MLHEDFIIARDRGVVMDAAMIGLLSKALAMGFTAEQIELAAASVWCKSGD